LSGSGFPVGRPALFIFLEIVDESTYESIGAPIAKASITLNLEPCVYKQYIVSDQNLSIIADQSDSFLLPPGLGYPFNSLNL